jgi:hypothetical protein
MGLPAVPARLLLAGATGLLLLGGIAGAATVDPDEEKAEVPEAVGSTDTSVAAPEAPPGETVAPAPVPGAPPDVGASTTATTAAATATTAAAGRTTTSARSAGGPAAPGALVAPKVGGYAYEATTTSASGQPQTNRTTTTVESVGTEGSNTIQTVTIPLDLGGQQATARNTVAWGSSGAVVRRSVISASALGAQQIDCAWQPPFAQYAGGLAVGKTWTYDTRCTGKLGALDVTVEQRATRKVTAAATVTGPAGAVATWTIADDTTVVVTTPFGATSVRTFGTQQLAPSLGVPVRSEMTVEARMGGASPERSTVTTKLVSLP